MESDSAGVLRGKRHGYDGPSLIERRDELLARDSVTDLWHRTRRGFATVTVRCIRARAEAPYGGGAIQRRLSPVYPCDGNAFAVASSRQVLLAASKRTALPLGEAQAKEAQP